MRCAYPVVPLVACAPAQGDSVIYTASGNQTVGVWDTQTARTIVTAEGHACSVRSVCALHGCEDVFATGGWVGGCQRQKAGGRGKSGEGGGASPPWRGRSPWGRDG